jgi:hypothetical protein
MKVVSNTTPIIPPCYWLTITVAKVVWKGLRAEGCL